MTARIPLLALLAAAIVLSACVAFPRRFVLPRPQPLLIYYGGGGSGSVGTQAARLAAEFQGYPVVVFGIAVQSPALAAAVRKVAQHRRLYGYVDVGHVTMREVRRHLGDLARLRFQGVLLDDVGTALSAAPSRLQRIVDQAHRDGLFVLLNAWDPRELLSLRLRAGKDALLCENWVYADGAWHSPRTPAIYQALRLLQSRGVRVVMGVTGGQGPVAPAAIASGVRRTVYREVGNYVAVSGPNYSAQTDAVFPARALRRLLSSTSF